MAAKKAPKQSRHWVVTVNEKKDENGWTEEDILGFEDRMQHLVNVQQVRYLVFSVEQGEDAEVKHLQMYVEFMRPKRLNEAKSVLGWGQAHLQVRYGTRTQAREYCTKQDQTHVYGPVEFGSWREDREGLKGLQRTLADRCVDLILRGYTPNQVAKEAPAAFFAHHRKVWALWRALNGGGE